MVNMSHDGYYWGAWNEVVLVVLFLTDSLLNFSAHILSLESELISYKVYSLCVKSLVDRNHYTYAHKSSDKLVDTYVHHCRKFAHRHELCKFQSLALSFLCAGLLVYFLLHSFTLFLSVFGSVLVLIAFVGETCKSLFNLPCNILFIDLYGFLVASAVFLFLSLVLLTAAVALLVCSGIDIHALLVDTYAFFLVILLCGFFLTFPSALFLAFLLWTCALVKATQVDFAKYVDFCSIEHFLLVVGNERFHRFCIIILGWIFLAV